MQKIVCENCGTTYNAETVKKCPACSTNPRELKNMITAEKAIDARAERFKEEYQPLVWQVGTRIKQ